MQSQKQQINRFIEAIWGFGKKLTLIDRDLILAEYYSIRENELICARLRTHYHAFGQKNPAFQEQMEILISIPGVGEDTAACMMAEIVDINLFSSASKLVKWAGLAPRVQQSGHRKRVTGKTYKGGNKYLRRPLFNSAINIYARGHKQQPLKSFMRNLKERKNNYKLSLTAGARKLLVVIHCLLRKKEKWKVLGTADPDSVRRLLQATNRKLNLLQRNINKCMDKRDQIVAIAYENSISLFPNSIKTLNYLDLYIKQS